MVEAKKIRSTQKDTEPQQFVTLFVTILRHAGGNIEIDARFRFLMSREEPSCGDIVAANP